MATRARTSEPARSPVKDVGQERVGIDRGAAVSPMRPPGRTMSMGGEITYDLVMEDDMHFIEGCYRLPGKSWEVLIVRKTDAVSGPEYRFTEWHSGATGLVIRVPRGVRLDRALVEGILSGIFHVDGWREVRGPDSMTLR
jgi:hypothetical protein